MIAPFKSFLRVVAGVALIGGALLAIRHITTNSRNDLVRAVAAQELMPADAMITKGNLPSSSKGPETALIKSGALWRGKFLAKDRHWIVMPMDLCHIKDVSGTAYPFRVYPIFPVGFPQINAEAFI